MERGNHRVSYINHMWSLAYHCSNRDDAAKADDRDEGKGAAKRQKHIPRGLHFSSAGLVYC